MADGAGWPQEADRPYQARVGNIAALDEGEDVQPRGLGRDIDVLEKNAAVIGELLNVLEDHLIPVLEQARPESEDASSMAGLKDPSEPAPLRQRIHRITNMMGTYQRKIEQLKMRAQI